MLNKVIRAIFRVMARLLLLLAGLVFLASLLLAALLLLAVWLLRALWARLNGRAVQPWTFQVNRQAMWSRFYRAPGQRGAGQRDQSQVIDVETKEVKPRDE